MACETMRKPRQTVDERKRQVEAALDRLKRALGAGEVTLKVGPSGSIAFTGSWERDDVSDACAFRKLQASGSPELRRALARAEALAGRSVDPRAINSGVHSHDGGHTWHKGH